MRVRFDSALQGSSKLRYTHNRTKQSSNHNCLFIEYDTALQQESCISISLLHIVHIQDISREGAENETKRLLLRVLILEISLLLAKVHLRIYSFILVVIETKKDF